MLKNLTPPHWVDPTVPGEAQNGETESWYIQEL